MLEACLRDVVDIPQNLRLRVTGVEAEKCKHLNEQGGSSPARTSDQNMVRHV